MKYTSREFYEVNGLKTFAKFKSNSFGIGKCLVSFVEFDTATKKLKGNIDIYIPISDMLLFANDVLSGKLPKQALKAGEGKDFPPPVFVNQGGTKAEKAKRVDGKPLARVFNFSSSSKKGYFLLQALSGPGKVSDKGLISLENYTKPEKRINVPCSSDDLKKLCLTFMSEYNSWLAGMYARKEFDEDISK